MLSGTSITDAFRMPQVGSENTNQIVSGWSRTKAKWMQAVIESGDGGSQEHKVSVESSCLHFTQVSVESSFAGKMKREEAVGRNCIYSEAVKHLHVRTHTKEGNSAWANAGCVRSMGCKVRKTSWDCCWSLLLLLKLMEATFFGGKL